MKGWAPRFVLAVLGLCGVTLGFAQVAPSDAPRGATHDCSGMTGTALAICRQLNRSVNEPALKACRALNGQSTEYDPSTNGAATTGGSTQQ